MKAKSVNLKNATTCIIIPLIIGDPGSWRRQNQQIVEIQNANHPHSSKLHRNSLPSNTLHGEEVFGLWEHSWVAVVDGDVIGYALNCEQDPGYFSPVKVPGRSLYIYILDVKLEYQNLGLGTELIRRSAEAFRETGFIQDKKSDTLVTIQTRVNNEPMRHVIEKKIGARLLGQRYYSSAKTDNVYLLS